MSEDEKQKYAPISDEELNGILNNHVDWLAFGEPWGKRAFLVRRDLAGRDLSWEYLKKADLWEANLERARLRDVNLERASFREANLKGAGLEGANLKGASLEAVNLAGADLQEAHLEGAQLGGAHLERAKLIRAKMAGAKLLNANLEGTVLWEAHLEGAMLGGAHLGRADLHDANLDGAKLGRAILEGANLFKTNLENAELVEADLKGAYLEGAILEGTDVFGVKYNRTITLKGIRVSNCYGSPMFRAFAMHQDFLEELQGRGKGGKFLYWLWNIFADCGRTPWLWIEWSILFTVGFGSIFFWMGPESFKIADLPEDNLLTYLYYSVVTFTTLGFGDVTPKTLPAAVLVMAEVVLGYVMLGGLISIFATLITPRR